MKGYKFHAKLGGNLKGHTIFEGDLELVKPMGSTYGVFSGYANDIIEKSAGKMNCPRALE